MNKSSLARIRWQVTLADHQGTQSPGWKLVEDFRKLSDEVHEVELLLESPELQKADFEDFSKQEDKLKVGYLSFFHCIFLYNGKQIKMPTTAQKAIRKLVLLGVRTIETRR